jgi:protein involved in polysaccharide export with SLBB domain
MSCDRIFIFALATTLMFASSCAPRRQEPLPYGQLPYYPPAAERAAPSTITGGDRLAVKFVYHQDLNAGPQVRADGRVTVPGLGDFKAAGITTGELEEAIYRRASLTLRDPEVSVIVTEKSERRCYVGGEVRRPGYVPVTPGMTALKAIFERGGYLNTAKVDNVLVVNVRDDGQYDASILNLRRVLETGDIRGDMYLTANDVVFVPKTAVANADLWVNQYIRELIPIREPSTRFETIGR